VRETASSDRAVRPVRSRAARSTARLARRLAFALAALHAWAEEKPALILGAAAGTTVSVIVLLAAWAGWGRVADLIETDHPWAWLLVCLAGEVVAYAGYVLAVRDMARVGDASKMSLAVSAQTVIAGFGVLAATRSSGGFAIDFWAFQRAGASREEAAARAVGLGLLEYVVLSLLALTASAALLLRIDGYAAPSLTLPALAVLPGLALGAWLTSAGRAARLTRPGGGLFRRWLAGVVAGALTVRTMLSSPRRHGLGVLGSVAYWAGDILCLWAALQLAGLHLSLAKLVLAYCGAYVVTRRALPAGGAGFVEAALTVALLAMGLPFAPTLFAVVVYRVFNFWLPILPALPLMPSVRELRERFRRAEQVVA